MFQFLKGVHQVDQGWITTPAAADPSEGVMIHYDPAEVATKDLVRVHLHTHSSSSDHSLRHRYRSAVYVRSSDEEKFHLKLLCELAEEMSEPLITRVLPFAAFHFSREEIRDYYSSDPERPFCTTYIEPKLRMLLKRFPNLVDRERFGDLG